MSSEQITQETVPVEKTETSTEPVKTEPTTETKPEVTQQLQRQHHLGKILLVRSIEKTQT